MREMLTMAAGERAANYDGLQVRTTGRHSISSLCEHACSVAALVFPSPFTV